MDNATAYSYDQVPYPSTPKPQTHPDRLATVATLFGLRPPPVDRCRVLELGCAGGGNLIPMAYGLPHSEFLGFDLSARHVAEGQEAIAALGLKNIAIQQADILKLSSAELGLFDYIVVYGVYSWVPEPVRDRILDICSQNLVPDGVAYVSYNTYPGWHLRGLIRDLLVYRTRRYPDLPRRASEARSFLDFLAESVPALLGRRPEDQAYGIVLESQRERLSRDSDSYLLHEYLEEVNEPVYFYQFAERAARHGLQFMSESMPRFYDFLASSNVTSKAFDFLRQLADDVIELEQYMDFLQNRTFRQSLLCHRDAPVDRALKPDRLRALHVVSPAVPAEPRVEVASEAVQKFVGPPDRDGRYFSFATGHPLTKAAMLHLGEIWPRAVPFEVLAAAARDRLGSAAARPAGEAAAADTGALAANLMMCFTQHLVVFHLHVPEVRLDISEKPVASPLARRQAQQSTKVTNLLHDEISLDDPLSYHLLKHLDGSRDRAALLEVVARLARQGLLAAGTDGGHHAPADLEAALDQNLRRLARAALLVA